MYQDCYLTDWVEWKDGKPQLKPEIQALGAGMEKVVKSVQPAINATLGLIDKAKVLGRVTAMLVRRAQEYMTHLQQFQFWATRAPDIYALKNYTGSLRFDTGYVHPDDEEDAYTAFGRGDGSR